MSAKPVIVLDAFDAFVGCGTGPYMELANLYRVDDVEMYRLALTQNLPPSLIALMASQYAPPGDTVCKRVLELDQQKAEVVVMPATRDALYWLFMANSYRIAVFTNTASAYVEALYRQLPIFKHRPCFWSCRMGLERTDPAAHELVQRELKVEDPQQIVRVTIHGDVAQAARASSWRTVLLPRRFTVEDLLRGIDTSLKQAA